MAVLARTNAQLDLVEAALQRADVPAERLGADHSPASDLHEGSRGATEAAVDAVALATIHRAKGLEWQHVAVIGFAEGLVPHYNATSPAELAEEQRLAYVALSRAESTLLITWSKGRDDARRADRAPSRYLVGVQAVLARLQFEAAPLAGEDRRARIAAIRRGLEDSASPVASPASGRGRPPR
jgi:DNA helicase-2/ATP-dependent DNA helicase PcrA